MRRTFFRRLRGGFTAVSLVLAAVLALAAAGMWVRSYWVTDIVGATRQTPDVRSRTVWSAQGQLVLYGWHLPITSGARMPQVGWFYRSGPASDVDGGRFQAGAPGVHGFAGVTYLDYTDSGGLLVGLHEWGLLVPYWLVVAVLGAWPAARVISYRRRRRRARAAAGLCPQCGYDLRATPEKCPECGEAKLATDGAPMDTDEEEN